MSPFSIFVLAVSMSVDAFAVSVGRGAAYGKPPMREALRTGLVFGIVEALTPLIGWTAGFAASRYVEAIDHWLAFALLSGVGLHILYSTIRGDKNVKMAEASFSVLIATAVGTSLDAMAVGVSLAFLDVNIAVVALTIGLATFIMSSTGMLLGRVVGEHLGKLAEVLAGLALCGLGALILYEHLLA